MVRGDTRGNVIMMGDHDQGFGFLRDVVIDQHLLKRNRQFDLVDVIRAKPELLGIGIDEGAGIVVQGDSFTVVGESYVAIYDDAFMGDRDRFYFLAPGDRFDLRTRTALRSVRTSEQLWVPHLAQEAAVPESTLAAYVGSYGAEEPACEVRLDEGRLHVTFTDGADPIDLVPVTEDTFYGEAWGQKVFFELDGSEVRSVTIGRNTGGSERYRRLRT